MSAKRTDRLAGPPPRRPRAAAGFSLIELMAALGILAFALPMIATAILSGMVDNQESFDSTMSAMVAENAIAVVRTCVSHEDLVIAWGAGKTNLQLIPDALPSGKVLVRPVDLAWTPLELEQKPEDSAFWCVVWAERMAADRNDYRLVAVVYKKYTADAEIDWGQTNPPEIDGTGKVTKYDVILSGTDESAAVGFLVVRTALRPATPAGG